MYPIFAKRAHASESGPSADVSAAAPKRPKSNPDSDVEDAPSIDSACDSFCDSPFESDHVELLTVAPFAVHVGGVTPIPNSSLVLGTAASRRNDTSNGTGWSTRRRWMRCSATVVWLFGRPTAASSGQ